MERQHITEVEIRATPDQVFRAITEAEEIVRWLAPIAKVEPGVGWTYIVSWGPENPLHTISSEIHGDLRDNGRKISSGSERKD